MMTDDANNKDNDATAKLHRLSWPFVQISQKAQTIRDYTMYLWPWKFQMSDERELSGMSTIFILT